MGGMLRRTPDGWRWIDGSPEARVTDLLAHNAYAFQRVTYADPSAPDGRARYVQIPSSEVREEPDLRDVVSLAGSAARRCEHTPSLIEVPEHVWDGWADDRVVGLLWAADDEADIFAKAESLRASRTR